MVKWDQADMDTILREILQVFANTAVDVYRIARIIEIDYPAAFAILGQPRGGYQSDDENSLPQYLARVGRGRVIRNRLPDITHGFIIVDLGAVMAHFPDGTVTRASKLDVSTFQLSQA